MTAVVNNLKALAKMTALINSHYIFTAQCSSTDFDETSSKKKVSTNIDNTFSDQTSK